MQAKTMYEVTLGLRESPFSAAPREDMYVPLEHVEKARRAIVRVLARGQGTALLIGGAGVGKTMLARTISAQLREQFNEVWLNGGQIGSRKALFQTLLHQVHLPFQGKDEDELRLAWLDYLSQPTISQRGLVLFCDEGQLLSGRMLEEIRLLTLPSYCGLPIVRVLLMGTGVLDERLASPKRALLEQRVASRSYLGPLSSEEVKQYVLTRLAQSGAANAEKWFGPDVWTVIRELTEGIPRLINQLIDGGLHELADRKLARLDALTLREVWAELQQLPAPPSVSGFSSQGASVIEFGALTANSTTQGTLGDLSLASGSAERTHLSRDPREFSPIAPALENHDASSEDMEESCEESETDESAQGDYIEFDLEASEELEFEESDDWGEPFKPAGRIGPHDGLADEQGRETTANDARDEVKAASEERPALVSNPFDEPFEDEEEIQDRCAKLQRATLQDAFESRQEGKFYGRYAVQSSPAETIGLLNAAAAATESGPKAQQGGTVPHFGQSPTSIHFEANANEPDGTAPSAIPVSGVADYELGGSPFGKASPLGQQSPFDFVVDVGPGVSWAELDVREASIAEASPISKGYPVDLPEGEARVGAPAFFLEPEPHFAGDADLFASPNAEIPAALEFTLNSPTRNVELRDYRLFFSELRGSTR